MDEWKKGNWQALAEWIGDFDISELCKTDSAGETIKLVSLDSNAQIIQFELVLGLIFAEYHKGLQNLLRIDDFSERDAHFRAYLSSLKKVRDILEHLYFEFKSSLEV